jgi:hypothetical protein
VETPGLQGLEKKWALRRSEERMVMSMFLRSLMLAGLVAVTGATAASAGIHSRDVAWREYTQKAPAMHEGRSAAMSAPAKTERADGLFHSNGCGLFQDNCYPK